VRSPTDEVELVQAAAAGDPAADAALWDAHGTRAFAFSHRVLGETAAAADAAQDAFLIAHAQLTRLHRAGEGFGLANLRAARTASFELLGRSTPATRSSPRGRLSAAAARLRPQQRAALALSGLERLSYAEIAAVLGIATESVAALLARARLRLHDELHGTALAAAAVRSLDCEDVVPLLAAAADRELDAADAAWADPHVERCPTCVRTVRAMDEAAATYAAWSPAASPSWLRAATLADLGAEAATPTPATVASARAMVPAALLGATCVTGAFAALLVGTTQSLHDDALTPGGARLPDGTGSMQMAAASTAAPSHHRARRAHRPRATRSATFVVARVAQPTAARSPAGGQQAAPAPTPPPQRKRRPATAPSATAPAPAQSPVASGTPPDEPSADVDAATTTAVAATATPSAPAAPAAEPPTTPPPTKLDAVTPPPPFPSDHEDGGSTGQGQAGHRWHREDADDDRWAAGACDGRRRHRH
jgi:DNA-directed RNA polymerase specialized sigma24 family protein